MNNGDTPNIKRFSVKKINKILPQSEKAQIDASHQKT